MLTRSTDPYDANMERTVSSVVPKLRLPTKMFFNFDFFLNLQSGERQDQTGAVFCTERGGSVRNKRDWQRHPYISTNVDAAERIHCYGELGSSG